ncbi:MAG: flagellar hook-length control protein FliK [Gammaproteobacteria bacterium]|nr:flagellar hook-length control protein FliK [Gammaproteobacteria bacterium]
MMNLGADVTPVMPSATPSVGLEPANGNGFAGVLGAALQSMPGKESANLLSPEQLLANQLLLTKLSGADAGLQQDPEQLADLLLPDGNILPPEDVDVSWQSLFSYFDSTDPETPYVLAMEGDNNGYLINELGPDELLENQALFAEMPIQAIPVHDNQQAAALLQERLDHLRLQTALQGQARQIGGLESVTALQHADQLAKQAAAQLISPDTAGGMETSLDDQFRIRNLLAAQLDQKKVSEPEQQFNSDLQEGMKGLDAAAKVPVQQASLFQTELKNLQADSLANAAGQENGIARVQSVAGMGSGINAYNAVSGQSGAAGQSQNAANVIANMTVPPDSPAWGDIIGNRVHWMANQRIQEAQIRLNPPELGMLEVRIQIGQDQQTNVTFSSPHSQVRDALENAMPRLREMFGANGLNLGDVDVSHHSMADHRHAQQGGEGENGRQNGGSGFASDRGNVEIDQIESLMSRRSVDGMLDAYA